MLPEKIDAEGFHLRKLKRSDADSILKYVNDEEVVKCTLNIPYPYTKRDAARFVNESIRKWREGKSYIFGVVIDREVVGICSLANVDKSSRHGTLGYWLGRNFWGKKIMSRASEAVVNFGFKELKLHRIGVGHFDENKASQRIIEKLGFKLEGTEREKIFRFGRWHNHLCYGLLEKEFSSPLNVLNV